MIHPKISIKHCHIKFYINLLKLKIIAIVWQLETLFGDKTLRILHKNLVCFNGMENYTVGDIHYNVLKLRIFYRHHSIKQKNNAYLKS